MKTTARLVVMSHLSDAQDGGLLGYSYSYHHINFAKFLILKYTDLSVEIDADKEWGLYTKEQEQKTIKPYNTWENQ